MVVLMLALASVALAAPGPPDRTRFAPALAAPGVSRKRSCRHTPCSCARPQHQRKVILVEGLDVGVLLPHRTEVVKLLHRFRYSKVKQSLKVY